MKTQKSIKKDISEVEPPSEGWALLCVLEESHSSVRVQLAVDEECHRLLANDAAEIREIAELMLACRYAEAAEKLQTKAKYCYIKNKS